MVLSECDRSAEREEIEHARRHGEVSVAFYPDGAFQEAQFIRYAVLERLVVDGRLAFKGRDGEQTAPVYRYGLPTIKVARAAA